MGDTGEEWEILEHSSSSSEESKTKSKVKWILDKGLNMGKKIVIAGVVISSAPLVIPQLVVISALGFALSVPSGILLSSYLCTKKLMSMLLPIRPDYLLMLEGTEEEEKEEFGDGYWGKAFENQYQDSEEKIHGSAKEEGYEEDVGEYLDIAGAEEEPLTNKAKVSDQANAAEDAKLDNENVEERESGTGRKEDIKESEDVKKVDVAREMAKAAADTKGTSAGNRDEKDIGDNVLAEKTIINGNEMNKKSAKKKKGNKKQDAGTAHEGLEKKKEVVHPTDAQDRDTSELLGLEEASESKQTAATPTEGRGERRSDVGKA